MPLLFTPPLDANGQTIVPYVLRFDAPAPGLNGSGGLMRLHWTSLSQLKALWVVRVRQAMSEAMLADSRLPLKRCEIVWTVIGKKEMDWENLYSKFKLVGDALRHPANKIIIDDNPRVILCLHSRWQKAVGKGVGCEVQIYPIS